MPKKLADQQTIEKLYELAGRPGDVVTTKTVSFDIMGRGLTKYDVCDALRDWIDAGMDVKETGMRGQDSGQSGYEIKPRINDNLVYCKFVIRDRDGTDELLVIVSAHPDH